MNNDTIMVHTLNIGLEFLALYATWRLGIIWLRVFLIYLLLFDIGGSSVYTLMSPHVYWYFYWVGRSLSFILQAMIGVELLLSSIHRVRIAAHAWGISLLLLLILTISKAWSSVSGSAMLDLSIVAGMICGVLLFVVIIFNSVFKYRLVLAGSVLFALITVFCSMEREHFAISYPLGSLVPLTIWSFNLVLERRSNDTRATAELRSERHGNGNEDKVGLVHKTI